MTWKPPEDPNGVILSYQLFVSIDPQDASYFTPVTLHDPIILGAEDRSYVLRDLHPFIEYQLRLSANTSVGMGNSTDVKSAITDMAGKDAY